MKKKPATRLAPHATELDRWFGEERLSSEAARQRLAALGCAVSAEQLAKWRAGREVQRVQGQLLEQLARGAAQCAEVQRELGPEPDLELATLIKLHRVLVLKLSLEAEVAPELLKLAKDLMKPVMEWARLQEKRKDRALAEQKHRDQLAAQKAAREPVGAGATAGGGLRPETLEKIERELNLF